VDKNDILDPLERELQRRRSRRWAIVLIAIFALVVTVYWTVFAEIAHDDSNILDHFKYGSIGSETYGGLPLRLWEVLPEAFPHHLPAPEAYRAIPAAQRTPRDGYRQFGFLVEHGRRLPIGFSLRRVGVDRVGLNCAVCHTGTIRVTEGMDPELLYDHTPITYADSGPTSGEPGSPGRRAILLGMPANSVNLTAYFEFLFACAEDPGFTVNNLMDHIRARGKVGPIEGLFYRRAIPIVREGLLKRRGQLAWTRQNPAPGPGRVDTFNPYWTMIFNYPWNGSNGAADFPSLWNQRPRHGMHLHWDGNNTSVHERNLSAAFGAGATPVSVDLARIRRVEDWIGAPKDPYAEPNPRDRAEITPRAGELEIPHYPFPIDAVLARRGEEVFYQADSDPTAEGVQSCASCHAFDGASIGQVVPIERIGTDRHRLDSVTEDLVANQNTLGIGHPWRFTHFRKTHGYASMPLDGIWARAPYLHNGSVPTLRALLEPPDRRPQRFYRGDDEYDPVRVGFRSDRPVSTDGRRLFLFETDAKGPSGNGGNGNDGHPYGVALPEADKAALVEYMKTIGGWPR
jgi:mono/diheme cytochrome c family protein